jgi:FlaA1/EpsC-like NDP-sugar epimerase
MCVKPLTSITKIDDKTEPHLPTFWRKPLLIRKKYQFALDLLVLTAAFYIAYLLRFEFTFAEQQVSQMFIQLLYVVLIQFGILCFCGVYAFVWRYVGIAEVRVFMQAAFLSIVPILILRFGLPEALKFWRVPLSIIIIDTILAFGSVLGMRVLRRTLYERYEKRHKSIPVNNGNRKRVLLIGAGRAGVITAKEILSRGDMHWNIKGFIDDDRNKLGSVIQGIKVMGTTEALPRLVWEMNIDQVVITIAEAPRRDIQRIVKLCESIPVKVQIIPGLYEILQGNVGTSRIRDLQIEDLLGREPVSLDEQAMKNFLAGKVVMVTGAGGSIGSELARQVALFEPSKLLLVERAEFALFQIDQEMRRVWPDLPIIPLVADVGDERRIRSILTTHRPQLVLHAAAHKHVPMMESNPSEAVKNNIHNTQLLGELSGKHGVEVFVLISTDKAVRPTSLMGACKRMAELVIQELDQYYATRYVAVRFGNVMGSTGSVIPIFREQILRGGPVTITHPDMMRYFMTIPEASQLVLQAGALGKGGEVFVLNMGEPVRVLDLAKDMITLSGLKPFEDIDIVFTGIRPGEKLFEELETAEEQLMKTSHPKIFISKIVGYPRGKVRYAVRQLGSVLDSGGEAELRRFLNDLLPEARLETRNVEMPGSEKMYMQKAIPHSAG